MSRMMIYHGSDHRIEKPDLSLGKKTNDYGAGFYTTQDEELACEWAAQKNVDGVLNEYIIDYTDLKILNLLDGKYNVLNWIALLLNNRVFNANDKVSYEAREYIISHFLIDTSGYDIIIGYRADDAYFSYAQSFINNSLSLELLSKAMLLGDLRLQIVFVSDKAIKRLEFFEGYYVDREEYYPKFRKRDTKAREDYNRIKDKSNLKTDIFILDIIRSEMKNDDKRIPRIILK